MKAIIAACLAVILGASSLCAQSGSRPAPRVRFKEKERRMSPDVKSHQGYATDGSFHYIFDTRAIYKRAMDKEWSLVASNMAPFGSLTNVSHLGDGDYYNGQLYVVAEQWGGCTNVHNQSILIYDAGTLDLIGATNISAQEHEVSGLAVAPQDGRNGIIYVTSYCDGSQIFKYDLTDFKYLGSLKLSSPIESAQGIAYDRGTFYVPSDGGTLYSFPRTGEVTFVYADKHRGSHEGLKIVDGEVRWLIDEGDGKRRIHFLIPVN